VLRCATKDTGGHIGYYVVSAVGRAIRPDVTQVKGVTTLAHGARRLDWYCEHPIGNLDGPIFALDEVAAAERRVNYAIGELEDVLLKSRRLPAQVALLWPRTTHIFNSAPEGHGINDISQPRNAVEQEFIHLHAALTQAGYPLDVLAEEDLARGDLKAYRVLYLAADQIQADAAAALKEWVRAGGCLYSVAGGGLKDESNKPLDTLKEVYGIKDATLRKADVGFYHKVTLPSLRPIETLTPKAGDDLKPLDAFCFYQTFTLAGGEAVATSSTGREVAAVTNRFGSGRAILVGTLPGVAMMKPAFPEGIYARSLREDDLHAFDPVNFDANARRWITLGARQAGVPPVAVCDPPTVETVVLAHDAGHLLCVINHGVKPLASVRIDLHGLTGIRIVRSQQRQAEVPVKRDGDVCRLQLPLGTFDFLVAER